MADSGVAKDGSRLPWLEPYRAPSRKTSNRRAGIAAAVGAIGLVAVIALLNRDIIPWPAQEEESPRASIVLPPPEDLQPEIQLPPLELKPEPAATMAAAEPSGTGRPPPQSKRQIRAVPTSAAFREVVRHQTGEAHVEHEASAAALAIAALPFPPDPPRPAVNPSAQVVRGKTVQLGVYKTAAQAEAAWRSAIRDYTYLVTMPKSIEPITIRSKRFYRLQLGTPSKKHARQLCANLKTTGRSCTVA
jgi:hypothetical protein